MNIISSGSRLRLYFKKIFLLYIPLEMLIKQNPREAVDGRINLMWETQGSEKCKRRTHQLLVVTWLGPLCWAGARSPSASSVDHSQLHFCPEKPLLRWELMHLPLLRSNLQLMAAWYRSSYWWCPAQIRSELQFMFQSYQWHDIQGEAWHQLKPCLCWASFFALSCAPNSLVNISQNSTRILFFSCF